MKAIIFILPFLLGIHCFGFETASGTYISEQDLVRAIRNVFFDPKTNPVTNNYEECVVYGKRTSDKLYELGFANLETGQRMAQEPDASYVLFLDTCISKITLYMTSYFANGIFLDHIMGQPLINEMLTSYSGSVLKHKNPDGTSQYTSLNVASIKPLSPMLREKIIDEVKII